MARGRRRSTFRKDATTSVTTDGGNPAIADETLLEEFQEDDEDEHVHTAVLSIDGLLKSIDFADTDEVLHKVANRTYFTVIVYDIVDNRRRSKLAKLLLGYGERVQYSGFEGHLTSKQIDGLCDKIGRLINEEEDRVRVYKIAGEPQVRIFGSVPLIEKEDFTVI